MGIRGLGLECHALSQPGGAEARDDQQYLIAELARSILVHETSLPRGDHSRIVGRGQGALLVVAEGRAPTAQQGAAASTVAVDTVTGYVLNVMPWLYGLRSEGAEDLPDALTDALHRCHVVVERAGLGEGDDAVHAGVSLTLAYVLARRAYVVHVGDTRCYLWRPPALRRVTRDHTLAQRLAEAEVITPAEVDESTWRRVLWQAVGDVEGVLRPEVYRVDLEPGDSLLLCTAGLTRHVADPGILESLSAPVPIGEGAAICRDLVGRARAGGSTGAVTVVLARTRPRRGRRRAAGTASAAS